MKICQLWIVCIYRYKVTSCNLNSNHRQDIVEEKDYEFIQNIEGDDLFDLAN
jgi:hypothetical protein